MRNVTWHFRTTQGVYGNPAGLETLRAVAFLLTLGNDQLVPLGTVRLEAGFQQGFGTREFLEITVSGRLRSELSQYPCAAANPWRSNGDFGNFLLQFSYLRYVGTR